MIGDIVTVTVDRPLGSYHPEYKVCIILSTTAISKELLLPTEKSRTLTYWE